MGVLDAASMDELVSDKRFAFVLGNSAYGKYGVLKNAARDVALIAEKFRALGFEVVLHTDLGPGEINAAYERFLDRINAEGKVDTAAIYYAGHGFQEGGRNHILSVPDADGNADSVTIHYLIGKLRSRSVRRLLFFDACRDYLNTNATADAVAMNRSAVQAGVRPVITTGLSDAEVDYGEDTMLSFSAAPGKPAQDTVDGSTLSPYAAALTDHMDSVGMSLDYVLKRVNANVTELTKGAQIPWTVEALKKPFYFDASPLLFLTGNLMAFVALRVALPMMLAMFYFAGVETIIPSQSSVLFPLLALALFLSAFGALLFGVSRAYSRALGAGTSVINKGVKLTSPLHSAIGGFLGGIIGAPLIALPYWWVWRQSQPFCQQFSWFNPNTPENCPHLVKLLVEASLASVFISAILGWLAVRMSNRLRQRTTGWAARYSDTTRLMIGATIGGTLAGLIVVPPLIAYFGAQSRPFLEPNYVMGFAFLWVSILAFTLSVTVVNYSHERFSRQRMIRSFWTALCAALIAPIVVAIPLGAVMFVLNITGFIAATLNWVAAGFFNDSQFLWQRYSNFLFAGVPYGLAYGASLGLLIGVAQILSAPWDHLPIFRRKGRN